MKTNNHNTTNTGFIFTASILSLISFAILSYSKYNLNGLSISEYRFDYIGNFLNIIITFFMILGFVVLGISKNNKDKKRLNIIISFLILIIIFTVAAYTITKVHLFRNNSYIFNISFQKAVSAIFFVIVLINLLFVLIYVWGIIFGLEKVFELRTLFRTISTLLLLFIFGLFFVWNVKPFNEEKIQGITYNYALIPGAAVYSKGKPSPIFAARIRKGFEILKKGKTNKLVLTGGNAPGEITEAEAAMKYLIHLGIKPEKLVAENETSTTAEQIKYLKNDLVRDDIAAKVLIISDGFHLTRALQICRFFNLNASGVSSDYSLSFEKTIFYRTRESVALLLFWFFAI